MGPWVGARREPFLNAKVVSLIRLLCSEAAWNAGPVAQRLEQQTHNLLVPGSNPGGPTKASHRIRAQVPGCARDFGCGLPPSLALRLTPAEQRCLSHSSMTNITAEGYRLNAFYKVCIQSKPPGWRCEHPKTATGHGGAREPCMKSLTMS